MLLAFDFIPPLSTLLGENPQPDALAQIIARKDEFESGKIETTPYIQWASELLDFHGEEEAFKAAWRDIFTPIEGTWELTKKLKADGHRLILYSNINAIHAPHCLETYNIFKHFDHAVFSHEIGAIKPQPEFFTRSFEKFNIEPSQTYYIDDMPKNIEAGKAHGLASFQYSPDKHNELLEWLSKEVACS